MKLLTKEIIARLPALYATEGVPMPDKPVIFKLFVPWKRGTWYVIEGQQEDGDWILFTYCESPLGEDCDELGYVSLNELAEVRGPAGLRIERDLYWRPRTLGEAVPKLKPNRDAEAVAAFDQAQP